MTVHDISPLEHNELPSNHETRAEYQERLKEGAESFLLHPALQELLVAAEAEGRVSEEELMHLADIQDNHDQYLPAMADLVNKAMNWRQTDNRMERFHLKDDDLSPEFRDTIKRAAVELMMIEEAPIPDGDFEVGAVLGATVVPVVNRTNYLYDKLEAGGTRVKQLVGLGAERPMMAPDLRNAADYPYVEGTDVVETNLLSHAARDWFARHGYDSPAVDPSSASISLQKDVNYDSRYRFQTVSFNEDQHRPEWAPDTIVTISAPFNKPHHPRANTGETIEFLRKIAELKSGNHALFISHQPYLLGQKFEIERLCLDADIRVDVAGYAATNPNLPATVWGGEIAKAAKKAAELREELTQRELDLAA
jgi:hypothetical protein